MTIKLRKFYEDGAAETGGGAPDFEVGGQVSLGEILNMQQSSEESASTSEEQNNEDSNQASDDATRQEQQTAGEQQEQTQTENQAQEGSTQEDPVKNTNQQSTTEQTQELTLEEVLKGKDRREVLKAIGVSEEIFEALESTQSLSDLQEYLAKKTKDWNAVSHQDVLRESLRREYADLDDAKFEKVFKAELKKYNLDAFDEEERELGEIRLERDANKIREQFKAEQAQFQLPQPKASVEAQQLQAIREAEAKQKTEYEQFVKEINEHAATKKLLADKRLVLADGYNFEVEQPQSVVDGLLDTRNLFKGCIKADGSYDLTRAMKIVAYAENMDKIEAALVEYGKSKVNQEMVDEYVNPSSREPRASGAKEETQAEAFANRGVHTTLGAILGR